MKVFLLALALLGMPAFALAAPDPQDSIIVESRTVAPGYGHPYFTIRVSITNKDSLSSLILPLIESSFSGGAYATLAHPRTFEGVLELLSSNFVSGTVDFNSYHSDSPDTFLLTGTASSPEPPNSTRKAVWGIKFDSVKPALGCLTLDSLTLPPNFEIGFIDQLGGIVEVNFVKSRIWVDIPPVSFGTPSSLTCCNYFDGGNPPPCCSLWVPAGDTLRYDFGLPCPGEWAFSMVSGPGSIDSNGVYTFPPHCQAGYYPFTFQVSGRPDVLCDCDSVKSNQYAWLVVVGFPAKGDLNCDDVAGPSDVVLLLRAVFLGEPPPAGMGACDFDCNGEPQPADVVVLLRAVFAGEPYPC